ncbi:hypothetical protein IAQ61_010831 [Plenodomus lingam]|uniref:uncharacterized protein n=1 Tax=Leptosphaeria maculans TaxID=5022 RepID=UPI00332BBC13|nr:hypothetical protein IAQ61_010831 [Plenodomus lingam]
MPKAVVLHVESRQVDGKLSFVNGNLDLVNTAMPRRIINWCRCRVVSCRVVSCRSCLVKPREKKKQGEGGTSSNFISTQLPESFPSSQVSPTENSSARWGNADKAACKAAVGGVEGSL